jgi:hypothetical protein
MKKLSILIVAAFIAFQSPNLIAQDTETADTELVNKKDRKDRAKAYEAKLVKELGLSKDQAKQFKEINKEYAQKAKDVRGDKEARKELFDERDAKIKAILSDEQFEKLKAVRKEEMKDRPNKGRKGKNPKF